MSTVWKSEVLTVKLMDSTTLNMSRYLVAVKTSGKDNPINCSCSSLSDPEFTVEGKFGISITGKTTVTSTRVHDQHESGLCWDYAAASSVRKSLRMKIGNDPFYKTFI